MPASPLLPCTAAPTTPGPSSSELAALVYSMHRSVTLQQQQLSELASLIRPLLVAPATTTASLIPVPAADPFVPWSSISAIVSAPLPGIVGAGVISTAPPQALAIAAEALGPAPASVASGSGETSLLSLSLASRHCSSRFNRVARERIRRNKSKSRGSHQRSAQPYCPAHLSRASTATLGFRSAASVRTPRP